MIDTEEREERLARFAELRAVAGLIPRCRAADVVRWRVKDDRARSAHDVPAALASLREMEEVNAELDAYLRIFAFVPERFVLEHEGEDVVVYPSKGCLCCGRPLGFRWDLVHGEASCGHCGWPHRVYHRPQFSGREKPGFMKVWLPYHPAELEPRSAS